MKPSQYRNLVQTRNRRQSSQYPVDVRLASAKEVLQLTQDYIDHIEGPEPTEEDEDVSDMDQYEEEPEEQDEVEDLEAEPLDTNVDFDPDQDN